MRTLPFKQVDVFTSVPFEGNPVAVVFDANGLTDREMQSVARWTNLSETTFVRTSKAADYLLRIFTPTHEIPFAGHPTIGSAHALVEKGIIPQTQKEFVQECKAGLIPLSVDNDGNIFARVPTPRIVSQDIGSERLVQALGDFSFQRPMAVDVGPVWIVARLERFDDLYGMEIDLRELESLSRRYECVGTNVYAVDDNNELHVRSFAPAAGIPEDPVCGSGNAAVALHVRTQDLHETIGSSYVSHQGRAVGRNGLVRVTIEGDEVSIGGKAVTVIKGEIAID